MSNVVRLHKPRVIVVEPKDPPDMLQLAELYAARQAALDRGDSIAVAEIEELAQRVIDRSDD
jgi:hypothetical protein